MKWLKKLIFKKTCTSFSIPCNSMELDHCSTTMQMVMDRIKYKEERAKTNREFLNGSHLTLKVVLDKIEDDRIKKSNKDVCQFKIN